MRQQVFAFLVEARNKALVHLDQEREQEVVRLMAALLIAVFEAVEEVVDGERAEPE
jgi:hypothetical protein